MEWNDFHNCLLKSHIYTINNNSELDIVLCGNCQMATIGFILNKLLDYKYNIHIIISWFFENNGLDNFNMIEINRKIKNILSKCSIFIYHLHINDYGIDATILPNIVDNNCLKLIVPNYRLEYYSDNYLKSLDILKNNIQNSNFNEFNFIIDNHKIVNFFNTSVHITHYLLFLQSQAIVNKILNNNNIITMNDYYDTNNRLYFKQLNYIILPGKENITNDISLKTGIKVDSDFFDHFHYYNLEKFDWEKYISSYDDLKNINNKEHAWHHWTNHGINEGRIYIFN